MAEATKISVDQVKEALREVYDPEIPVNVIDLGLIYDIQIDDSNEVFIKMTLTFAGCGMGPYIAQQAEWAIAEIKGVKNVNVELTFDPPWSSELITEEGKALIGL